ncbi:hypothetical protein JCM3765_003202 [Sporobolomyces pararoseus]
MELDILSAWQTTTRDLGRINQLSVAWSIATDYLDASKLFHQTRQIEPPSRRLIESIKVITHARMMDQLLLEYLNSIKNSFKFIQSEIILPHLKHSHSQESESEQEPEAQYLKMLSLLDSIGNCIKNLQQPLNWFYSSTSTSSTSSLNQFRKTFLSCLYYHLSISQTEDLNFSTCLTNFLRILLMNLSSSSSSSTTTTTVTRLSYQEEEFPLAFPTLITLLDRYDPLLFSLIYERIEFETISICKSNFRRSNQLTNLLKWLNQTVLTWVTSIYNQQQNDSPGNSNNEEAKKFLKPTFSRFEYHVHKVLAQLRTSELFDIILDFPESKPALEDLKLCLIKTDQKSLLISRLHQQFNLKLLHPGIETRSIIKIYIKTIRCLRLIDPPGVLLSRVVEKIKQYLKTNRKDTIRCIVSSLIQQGEPLFEELKLQQQQNGGDGGKLLLVSDSNGDDAENFTDQKWLPDPVDAPKDFRKSKTADILQLLISIYDTKEVFIKELQVLMAQRLLNLRDYSLIEKEFENLEILKLRFGEQSLQGLEVMLKDLKDSQQIDQSVHQLQPLPLHSTIVSRLFWPSFQTSSTSSNSSSSLKLPGQLGKIQSKYDQTFTSLKSDKKLKWLPSLGNVNLTIEMKDGRTFTLDSTPIQAAVLELFSSSDTTTTWTIENLQTELKLSDISIVRNALFFWNNLGILKASSNDPDQWQLVEEQPNNNQPGVTETNQVAHVIEEEKQAVQSVEEQGIAQMRVFWQFIQGMLTNLGTLPLSRIHSTLNMLAPGYKGKTLDELKALLQQVESEGLVRKLPSGSYKIVK